MSDLTEILTEVQGTLSGMIDQLCEHWKMPRYPGRAVKAVQVAKPVKEVKKPTMKTSTNAPTQTTVLDFLRHTARQWTTQEIASNTTLTPNQVKHAVARLLASGQVLRTQNKPARWYAAPQVVEAPPQGSVAPLHGTMPSA